MRIVPIILALALTCGSSIALADTLGMPDDASSGIAVPAKGSSMASVTRQFGQPSQRHAPVGGGSAQQPPITRWDYPGFSVFFEYDHVVDSVIRDQPATVHNTELLQSN